MSSYSVTVKCRNCLTQQTRTIPQGTLVGLVLCNVCKCQYTLTPTAVADTTSSRCLWVHPDTGIQCLYERGHDHRRPDGSRDAHATLDRSTGRVTHTAVCDDRP